MCGVYVYSQTPADRDLGIWPVSGSPTIIPTFFQATKYHKKFIDNSAFLNDCKNKIIKRTPLTIILKIMDEIHFLKNPEKIDAAEI